MPRQTRPNMVVKTFRIPEPLWAKFAELAAAAQENPSDRLRRLIEADVKEES